MIKKLVKTIWGKLKPATRLKIVRATQENFTVSAAAIVVNEKEEVLLLDHVLRANLSWGIPGGFVGRGEQPEAAVRREIREETGLELKNIEMIRVQTINRHVEIIFRAEPVGTARIKSFEINDLGWFVIGKMPERINQAQKSIIENVLISGRNPKND